MDALLVGSAAAQYRVKICRDVKDYDLFVRPYLLDRLQRYGEVSERRQDKSCPYKFSCNMLGLSPKRFEIEIAVPGSSAAWFMDQHEPIKLCDLADFGGLFMATVAKPEALMAIKRSHLTWPRFWCKHIADYHRFKAAGYSMGEWEEGCRLRYAEKLRHDPPTPQTSLNVSNNKFFHVSEEALRRTYNHDDLHRVVAYYDRPLYERSKPDLGKALMSRHKFERLPRLDQLRTVREEAMAIALERRIIPLIQDLQGLVGAGLIDKVRVPASRTAEAYDYALRRICTTLTRGWFRDFAIENWPDVKMPDVDFPGLFLEAIESGGLVPKVSEAV